MRKLATAAAVSLALASGGAFGLGLGDIEMRSALNQPMNAEIRLTSVKPGELDGMIVQLASADAFLRAGIERSTALTDLVFTVDQSGPSPIIRISSRRPVVEPFLNFLVEVDWPQGRMVREYTVLLDPPVFMSPSATERNSTADQPVMVQRGDEALVVPTPIERSVVDLTTGVEVDLFGEGELVSLEPLGPDAQIGGQSLSVDDGEIVSLTDLSAPNTAAIAQREANSLRDFDLESIQVEVLGSVEEIGDETVVARQTRNLAPGNEADGSTIVSLDGLSARSGTTASVTVNRGDTLFEIAQSNLLSGVSVQQMMLALLAANENAFINSNINLVRAGSILRLPNQDEAARLTQAQALAAIGQQNQLWQEYRDNLRNAAATRLAQAPGAGSTDSLGVGATGSGAASAGNSPSTSAIGGLSAEAQAILDNARNELSSREELRLVADNAPTSTAASATADETRDNEAQRLGEVNRKLQLAREELSSNRLQTGDLSDQVVELETTTENLDALVSLRQNEVAQLEAQLADARRSSAAAAETSEDLGASVSDVAQGQLAGVTENVSTMAGDALNTASTAVDTGANAVQGLVNETNGLMPDSLGGVRERTEAFVDSGANALTAAGESLAQVELLEEPATPPVQTTEAVIPPPRKQTTWYEDFLADPKRMAIAGIGGVGLLGVLGTLLYRRRRLDDDDSMLDFDDEVEFIDDEEEAQLRSRMQGQKRDADSLDDAYAAVGVGGVAAAAAHNVGDRLQDDDYSSLADSSLDLGSETQAVADATGDDELDADDTISEVGVYLAYGLHGQAEDLLHKAMERRPNHQEYAEKLLQTYHAQGNESGFHQAAKNFHARFGGEANPEWPAIAAMGAELMPGEALYSGDQSTVASIGARHDIDSRLSDDDFLPANESAVGSINRGFASSGTADYSPDHLESEDESDLMDQSLDPAFAFDEADLEATGDFSEIASELAAETDDGLDYPGFGDTLAAAQPRIDEPSAAMLEDELGDFESSLGEKQDSLSNTSLSMEDFDNSLGSSDDLTLDLDQLSGDLELDADELLNSDLSDLEIPDLTADNERLVDEANGIDSSDEMDTMLDLARAYIDMGDKDSASSALDEIVKSGNPDQVNQAETLLRNIS